VSEAACEPGEREELMGTRERCLGTCDAMEVEWKSFLRWLLLLLLG